MKCEQCKEKILEGHVLINGCENKYFCNKYFCIDCFAKLYTDEEMGKMYDNEEQYYTTFEE